MSGYCAYGACAPTDGPRTIGDLLLDTAIVVPAGIVTIVTRVSIGSRRDPV